MYFTFPDVQKSSAKGEGFNEASLQIKFPQGLSNCTATVLTP